ncbi:YigZ family protein [Lacticaseibacillus daqingensis]|uniref:YigZ family protein n=1 Tax=Lacticaseibacillus daqingensis TaxID=2486014 RepID=UPI000F7B3BE3|nr:YigZ family protein [Lacticaseibacillus daqingensis]
MSDVPYRTIQQAGEHELVIKKSRFICHLARVKTEAEAQAFITQVKKTHYKATHNVPAYLLGDHDEIQRANDDGEPSGTAGVPMLQVLQQMQLHDVVAVVTRYFGGIKLGAGGLIRAYANSVQEAVHAVGIVQREQQRELAVTLAYPQLGAVEHWLAQADQPIAASQYGAAVTLTLFVPVAAVAATQAALIDLTHGQAALTLGGLRPVEVPVTAAH